MVVNRVDCQSDKDMQAKDKNQNVSGRKAHRNDGSGPSDIVTLSFADAKVICLGDALHYVARAMF